MYMNTVKIIPYASLEYEPSGKEMGREGMEVKEKGSYLRLIPGLCVEDKMNR